MNWICPICSTANPKSERECFVCGSMRDEAEILAEAMAAEAARREAERLARIEAERRAEEERRRAEEAERRRIEEERRARLEAERLARLAEERRRLAAEAAVRAEREAKDRRLCDKLSLICKIALISSLSLFTLGAIGALVILAISGSVGDVVPNIFTLVFSVWDNMVRFATEDIPVFLAEFIPSSYMIESFNSLVGSINRSLIELVGEKFPAPLECIEVTLSGALAALLALLTHMGDSLAVLWTTVVEIFSSIGCKLSDAFGNVGRAASVAEGKATSCFDSFGRVVELSIEKLNEIKN